ncbi:MAG: RlmE family RNA methyltransferase [Myxococcota bacterium]
MYVRKDSYYKKAKAEGYRSRAAYKLIELNGTHRLYGRGQRVLDVGCAPGGFLQVVADTVGPSGCVVGIDLLETVPVGPNVKIFLGDAREAANQARLIEALGGAADCVLSDMAPNTSGVGFADAFQSFKLASMVLDLCATHLKKGGMMLVKVFVGSEFEGLKKRAQTLFDKVVVTKPDATRKGSREVYMIGTGYKA